MTDPTPTRDEAVPTGWKLVPIEPTKEMLRASPGTATCDPDRWRAAMWAAMLASAPAPASGRVDAVAWQTVSDFVDEMLRDWSGGDDCRMGFGLNGATVTKGQFRAVQAALAAISEAAPKARPLRDFAEPGQCNCGACLRIRQASDLERQRASLSPAATPVSEAEGEVKGWAAVYDGQIKSCHRSRETCVADAEHYQAIHPVYLGPAWRHQED